MFNWELEAWKQMPESFTISHHVQSDIIKCERRGSWTSHCPYFFHHPIHLIFPTSRWTDPFYMMVTWIYSDNWTIFFWSNRCRLLFSKYMCANRFFCSKIITIIFSRHRLFDTVSVKTHQNHKPSKTFTVLASNKRMLKILLCHLNLSWCLDANADVLEKK